MRPVVPDSRDIYAKGGRDDEFCKPSACDIANEVGSTPLPERKQVDWKCLTVDVQRLSASLSGYDNWGKWIGHVESLGRLTFALTREEKWRGAPLLRVGVERVVRRHLKIVNVAHLRSGVNAVATASTRSVISRTMSDIALPSAIPGSFSTT